LDGALLFDSSHNCEHGEEMTLTQKIIVWSCVIVLFELVIIFATSRAKKEVQAWEYGWCISVCGKQGVLNFNLNTKECSCRE
jgi:hypothetical protein